LAGIYLVISNYVDLDLFSAAFGPFGGREAVNHLTFEGPYSILLLNTPIVKIKPYGPHILPIYLTEPLRIYKPNLNRNLIGIENRGRTIIYQWINLINGKMYVGSAWNGSQRLLSYWTHPPRPSRTGREGGSVLKRNLAIYNSIAHYTHDNFILSILEDLGAKGSVSKDHMLSREQIYLDLLFNKYPLLALNNSPTAGTTLGFKHKPEFGINRSGKLNPMSGRTFTPEFIEMQKRNKAGVNNPLYGVVKSPSTIAKITKLVYVYDAENMNYIDSFSTVECSKEFKMGKDTLSKYLLNGLPFKGRIFSRTKLHKN